MEKAALLGPNQQMENRKKPARVNRERGRRVQNTGWVTGLGWGQLDTCEKKLSLLWE